MGIPVQAVCAALQRAEANVRDAANGDGRTTRAELDAKLDTLEGVERQLTDLYFGLAVFHYGSSSGNSVADERLGAATDHFCTQMIDRYDESPARNGLNDHEIRRMSAIGKLAVALAQQLEDQQPAREGGLKATYLPFLRSPTE